MPCTNTGPITYLAAHIPRTEMRGPILNSARYLKHRIDRGTHESLVDSFHWTSERHRPQVQRACELLRHQCTGAQLVVTRKPRRRRATGLRAIASCTVSTSSSGVKPRITETTPSWRLTA